MKTVDKKENQWIDLGLPSGNLWKSVNEDGYFTYNDAVEKFKDNLPTIVDFAELIHYCKWEWSEEKKGMVVIGPNKNNIFMKALGRRLGKTITNVGFCGDFRSISLSEKITYNLFFDHSSFVNISSRYPEEEFCVYCVKHK